MASDDICSRVTRCALRAQARLYQTAYLWCLKSVIFLHALLTKGEPPQEHHSRRGPRKMMGPPAAALSSSTAASSETPPAL